MRSSLSASEGLLGASERRASASEIRSHPLRWRLEATALLGATAVANALPESAARRFGATVAAGAGLGGRVRRVSLENLRVAFPEWTETQRRRVLGASLRELGRNAAAWSRLPRVDPADLDAGVEWRGVEHLEKAWARGRGVLAVTAHFGYWELILPAARRRFAHAPARITAVERALPNPRLRSFANARRRLGGVEPLPQRAGAILRALRENATVGVLVDHYLSPRRGGVLAPFLGRRAWTNPGPATLARRAGSALLPVRAEPLGDGRHRIHLGPAIEVSHGDDPHADVLDATARVNAAIESWIRERPELWLWAHRRFRRSPDVEDTHRRGRAR